MNVQHRTSNVQRPTPNEEQTSTLVQSEEWQQALALWMELEKNSKSKGTKSKAQFNIAVAHELLGDINQAIIWALKSYKTTYRLLTYEYLETLKSRRREIQNQKKLKLIVLKIEWLFLTLRLNIVH